MPTNPRAGFQLTPVRIRDDEDYQKLTAEQRGIWRDIMSECYSNRDPWRRGNLELPAYSMITTMSGLAKMCNVTPGSAKVVKQRCSRCVARLRQFGWISVTAKANCCTIITLTKAGRWQDFATYRSRPVKQSDEDCEARLKHDRSTDRIETSPSPSPSLKTTTTGEDSLFPPSTAKGEPLEASIETADLLRDLVLEAGGGTGFKRIGSYRANHRGKWARALKTLEGDDPRATAPAQRELARWAFCCRDEWPDRSDGSTWTWGRVLRDAANPAAKLAEKFATLWKVRERDRKREAKEEAAAAREANTDEAGMIGNRIVDKEKYKRYLGGER